MSTLTRGRRLAVEVSWDEDKDAILWVGAVPLHQHWPKLAPHFGDLLLAPQRRIDGSRVGWTWKLPDELGGGVEGLTATSAQLALLRRRLAGDLRAFEQAMSDGPRRDKKLREALLAVMVKVCRNWEYAPDAVLRQYVAQTDRGLRLHSWSAVSPSVPQDPDGHHAETQTPHERGAHAPGAESSTKSASRASTGDASAGDGDGSAQARDASPAYRLIRRWIKRSLLGLLLLGLGGGSAVVARKWYLNSVPKRNFGTAGGYSDGMNGAPASGSSAARVEQRPLPENVEEPTGVGGGMGGHGSLSSSMASAGGFGTSISAAPTSGPARSDSESGAKPADSRKDRARPDAMKRDAKTPQKPKAAIKWDFTVKIDASPFKLDWTLSPAAVPVTFIALHSSRGLSVDIPANLHSARWELPDGLAPSCAIAAPQRAQLASRPEAPLIPGTYELRDATDAPFIQIKIANNGAVTAAVARGARLYYWFAVHLSPEDRPPQAPAARFSWERPWAAALPATWRMLITPNDARVEVPVLPLTAPQQIESFSLHDRSSSWSLTAKVRERPD